MAWTEAILPDVPLCDALTAALASADHVDVKRAEGTVGLSEFLAGLISYRPLWVRLLFRVRGVLAWALCLKNEPTRTCREFSPENTPMTPGQRAGIFTVHEATADQCWIGFARDRHLAGYLAVVTEPLQGGLRRFYVITAVHYLHWTGPIYFNLIRSFHHLIVGRMARAAARGVRERAHAT